MGFHHEPDLRASPGSGMTSAERTKLAGIEAGADVTDAANVAAAGALMSSALGVTVQGYDADLADIAAFSDAQGDIIVRGSAGWERLAKSGTATDLLAAGASQPGWVAAPAAGTAIFTWSGAAYTRTDSGGAYTKIVFLDSAGGHDPTTAAGGRTSNGDQWVTGEAALVYGATFSDTNHTMSAGYTYAEQTGTLTAVRTVTLPAASTLTAGKVLTVANRGAVGVYYLTVQAAGADTITNPGNLAGSTVLIRTKDAAQFSSDGVSKWFVVNPGTRRPFSWWQHPNDLAVPSGVWVPVSWNSVLADEFGVSPNLQGTTTTVAAGSNGVALPTATVNVASTSGFSSSGCIVITGPPGAGDDTIIHYTGTTSTSFTGCDSAAGPSSMYPAGISTGTLATGQTVTQANVEFFFPTGYLWQSIVELAMGSIATSAYWSVKFMDTSLGYSWGSADFGGLNIALQHGSYTMQPGGDTTVGYAIFVKHNAGSVKLCKKDGVEAPSLMQAMMSAR